MPSWQEKHLIASFSSRLLTLMVNSVLIICISSWISLLSAFSFHKPYQNRKVFSTLSNAEEKNENICVVGGGFGGLYAALGLRSNLKPGTNIYLIDPKERFVFLPLLYELAMGSASETEVAPRYSDILKGTEIKFIRGTVEDIDFVNKKCFIKETFEGNKALDRSLTFDQLVLSVGNQPRLSMIPGAENYAIPFYSLSDCIRLKKTLEQLKCNRVDGEYIRVIVIGAGYSGVELAANVAEYFGPEQVVVHVLDRGAQLLPSGSRQSRLTSERAFTENCVKVSHNSRVQNITEKGVNVIDDTGMPYLLEADLVLCTVGSEPSALIQKLSSLPKTEDGRVKVRDTLQVVGLDDVFCLGDNAAVVSPPTSENPTEKRHSFPATAQVALQQAQCVAHNVALRHHKQDNKKQFRKFSFFSLGEMLSLGTYRASISSLGGLVHLSGPLAAVCRRAVYAIRMPTAEQSLAALITASSTTAAKIWSDIFSKNSNSASCRD